MPWVYILTNKPYGTLYIGSTVDLLHRLNQHKTGNGSVFTARHKLHQLVHAEEFSELRQAQAREHQLKSWHRDWKINLITATNPDWQDRTSLLS